MNLEDLKENKAYQIVAGVIAAYIVCTVMFYFIAIAPKVSMSSELKAKIVEKQSFLLKAGSMEKQREKIEEAKAAQIKAAKKQAAQDLIDANKKEEEKVNVPIVKKTTGKKASVKTIKKAKK